MTLSPKSAQLRTLAMTWCWDALTENSRGREGRSHYCSLYISYQRDRDHKQFTMNPICSDRVREANA